MADPVQDAATGNYRAWLETLQVRGQTWGLPKCSRIPFLVVATSKRRSRLEDSSVVLLLDLDSMIDGER